MSFTGEFIKFGGLISLTVGSTVSIFLVMKAWSLFSGLEDMKEEFEDLWKRGIGSGPVDETLTNLSYVHKAVKRQMEGTDQVEKHLLDRAIKKADQKRSIFKSGKQHHMYYVAHRKLKDLKKEIN